MLVLRDGRKLIGVLRSWDQFGMPVQEESYGLAMHLPGSSSHPA